MDAVWVSETLAPQIYFVNNSGHEALFQHIVAVLMKIAGATPIPSGSEPFSPVS